MSEMSKKRKKKGFYGFSNKKSKYSLNLTSGLKGFLCTHNGHPKFCIREAYNILDEFKSNKDKPEEEDKEEEDFESELQRDLDNVKSESSKKEFQVVETGVAGCVFISSANANPSEVMKKIIENIVNSGQCQTRKILRMIPIQVTCKAYPDDIKKAAVTLFDDYFNSDPKSYAIVINRRNNSNIVREELIQTLGLLIRDRNPFHTADLKQPQMTVLVEILKSICCLSVIENYNKFRKYNLIEIGLSLEKNKKESDDKRNDENGKANLDENEEKNGTSETSKDDSNTNNSHNEEENSISKETSPVPV